MTAYLYGNALVQAFTELDNGGANKTPKVMLLRDTYTFDAAGAVQAARAFSDALIVPVHYEGWTHFAQGRAEFEAAFTATGLDGRVRWLRRGEAVELGV